MAQTIQERVRDLIECTMCVQGIEHHRHDVVPRVIQALADERRAGIDTVADRLLTAAIQIEHVARASPAQELVRPWLAKAEAMRQAAIVVAELKSLVGTSGTDGSGSDEGEPTEAPSQPKPSDLPDW